MGALLSIIKGLGMCCVFRSTSPGQKMPRKFRLTSRKRKHRKLVESPSSDDLQPSSPKQVKSDIMKGVAKMKLSTGIYTEGLTSDAHLSKEAIQASQLKKQPYNLWYGKEKDEPDSDVVQRCVADGADEDDSVVIYTLRGPLGGRKLPFLPTGKGTTVAILDSGINAQHSTFKGGEDGTYKLSLYSKSFVSDDYSDQLGHGTQCAGLLCGSPDNVGVHDTLEVMPFQGISPGAKVMVCKVVKDGTATADIQAVCDAVDHILKYNHQCVESGCFNEKVNVISMSFGMPFFNHSLTNKIQEAVYDDIIVVCAASNDGKKTSQPINYPARLGHVLCIGASTADGEPAGFSPVGREIDFLACGESIWAPTTGTDAAYTNISGTSFAAPLVAGVVCQIVEDLKRLSGLTSPVNGAPLWMLLHNVWCMRELLKEMAVVKGKHRDKSGFGILNPREYFEKNDEEKIRIIKRIVGL